MIEMGNGNQSDSFVPEMKRSKENGNNNDKMVAYQINNFPITIYCRYRIYSFYN